MCFLFQFLFLLNTFTMNDYNTLNKMFEWIANYSVIIVLLEAGNLNQIVMVLVDFGLKQGIGPQVL